MGFRVTLLGLAAIAFPVVFGLQLVEEALGARVGIGLPKFFLGAALMIVPLSFLVAYIAALVGTTRREREEWKDKDGGGHA